MAQHPFCKVWIAIDVPQETVSTIRKCPIESGDIYEELALVLQRLQGLLHTWRRRAVVIVELSRRPLA